MNDLTLNIIDSKVNIKPHDGIMLRFLNAFIFISLLFVLMYFDLPKIVQFVLLIGSVPIIGMTRRIQRDWITYKNVQGTITFNSKYIVFNHNAIPLAEINNIKLTGDYYRGFNSGILDITHNGLYKIEIKSKESNIIAVKFIVFNKSEFENLINYFKFIYTDFNIEITEYIGPEHIKGLLLRHDRNYAEIKKLKDEISVERRRSTQSKTLL